MLSAIFPSYQHMANHFPASSNLDTKQFIGWIIFNVLMGLIIYIKPERIQWVVLYMNIISFITLFSIMVWCLSAAHGAGPLLSAPASATGAELGWGVIQGITTVIGGIAVGLTNQMDYSRFARRPGDQVLGQWTSIMGFGVIMPLFGCLASSASLQIYGKAYWNPPDLVQRWLDEDYNAKSRAGAFFAGFGLVVCQLAINSIDNAFSSGMDLSGLFPSYINIRRGGYVALVLSIAMCPWQLLSSAATFISVLSAYSVFLGPMVGLMICDYFVVRHRKIKLSDLYHPRKSGIYYYAKGWNWRTLVAWVVGWVPMMPGFAHAITPSVKVPQGCTYLFYLAYPVGFVISFLAYWAINTVSPPPGINEIDGIDYYQTFTPEEAARLQIAEREEEIGGSNADEFDDKEFKIKQGEVANA